MRFSEKSFSFGIHPLAPPLIFVALCFTPSALTLLASVFHELGHISVILLLGGRIRRITVLPVGAEIDATPPRSYLSEALICSAGAVFNIISGSVSALLGFEYFFAISIGLALFNLLPVKGLDGGELLLCLLLRFLDPEKASRILSFSTFFSLFSVWLVAVWIMIFLDGSVSLFIMVCVLFSSTFLHDQPPAC